MNRKNLMYTLTVLNGLLSFSMLYAVAFNTFNIPFILSWIAVGCAFLGSLIMLMVQELLTLRRGTP